MALITQAPTGLYFPPSKSVVHITKHDFLVQASFYLSDDCIYYSCRWEHFDKKYLRQMLMRKSAYRNKDDIWDVYHKLNVRDAISYADQVQIYFLRKVH